MIKLAIIDDHPATLEGLVSWCNSQDDMEVVYKSSDGHAAAKKRDWEGVDVLITDVKLGYMEAWTLVNRARVFGPQTIKFIVYSSFASHAMRFKAKLSRVHEFADINDLGDAWMQMIRDVHAGLPTSLSKQSIDDLKLLANELTNQELRILECVAAGASSQQIADTLSNSVKTIETHRTNILRKLEAKNMSEAISRAYRLGVIK